MEKLSSVLRSLSVALLLALVATVALPAIAEITDLEGLTAFVASKAKATPAWSADSETTISMMGMSTAMKGTILVKGDTSIMNTSMDMRGEKRTMRQVVDADGVLWSENAGMGKTMVVMVPAAGRDKATGGASAMGNPVDPSMAPEEMLKKMAETFDLTFKGAADLDGAKAYLIEGKLKADGAKKLDATGMMQQMGITMDALRMWFSTEDGLTRKLEMLDKEGKPFITQVFTNINLKPEIGEDTFKYTPPEGAQVIDASKMKGMGAPGGAAPPEAPPAPPAP